MRGPLRFILLPAFSRGSVIDGVYIERLLFSDGEQDNRFTWFYSTNIYVASFRFIHFWNKKYVCTYFLHQIFDILIYCSSSCEGSSNLTSKRAKKIPNSFFRFFFIFCKRWTEPVCIFSKVNSHDFYGESEFRVVTNLLREKKKRERKMNEEVFSWTNKRL